MGRCRYGLALRYVDSYGTDKKETETGEFDWADGMDGCCAVVEELGKCGGGVDGWDGMGAEEWEATEEASYPGVLVVVFGTIFLLASGSTCE